MLLTPAGVVGHKLSGRQKLVEKHRRAMDAHGILGNEANLALDLRPHFAEGTSAALRLQKIRSAPSPSPRS